MTDASLSLDGAAHPTTDPSKLTVFELRRYRLRSGARDTLIGLFDRHLVETQEAVGISVLGQFRDLDDPDAFVWIRGFPDMAKRAAALGAFYGGPVWARHREAANATMLDSDDVLMLRLAEPFGVLSGLAELRAAPDAAGDGPGVVGGLLLHLDPRSAASGPLERHWQQVLAERVQAAGARLFGVFVTEDSANSFPRLPVREGERVWLALAGYPDVDVRNRVVAMIKADPIWARIQAQLIREPEMLALKPTARSLLHGVGANPPSSEATR